MMISINKKCQLVDEKVFAYELRVNARQTSFTDRVMHGNYSMVRHFFSHGKS